MGSRGTREFIQVLRLMEALPKDGLEALKSDPGFAAIDYLVSHKKRMSFRRGEVAISGNFGGFEFTDTAA